ncbi:hypothetical protein ACVGWI_01395, partial [Enterobacter hormaechei]
MWLNEYSLVKYPEAVFPFFFIIVCPQLLPCATGNAANPVSAVRATDVMVNQPSVDKGSDNTHVG